MRLKLRRFKLSDVHNMIELEADPEVMKFTPSRIPQSLDQTETRLKSLVEQETANSPFGVWAIELKESGGFVGWMMLLKSQNECPELGFMVVRRHWNKGLTTEAATCLIEFGFNELLVPAIVATTDRDNHSSKRVLSKLGFLFVKAILVPDKILQQDIFLDVFELPKQPDPTIF